MADKKNTANDPTFHTAHWGKTSDGMSFPDGAAHTILANCNPAFKIRFTAPGDGSAGLRVLHGPIGSGMTVPEVAPNKLVWPSADDGATADVDDQF